MRSRLIVGLLPLLLITSSLAVARASSTRQRSVAYKMAAIDCKCVPARRTVLVYQRLLTKLVTKKCKETPPRLADEIVATRNILKNDGYGSYKLLTLMRLLDRSIPNSIGFRQRCADVLAALVVLIEKG
jgi:hypothetical protein